jgi:hypothetical protein
MRESAATVMAVLSVAAVLLLAPLASAAPPVPTIDAGPTGTINTNTPTFTFSSAGATGFTCSIAGPTAIAATACNSGSFTAAPALSDGACTFTVTVLLTWALPADRDVAFVRIERSVVGTTGSTVAYRGLGKTFTSKRLSNGVAYRFTLVAVDKAGNSSKPVVVSATPKALLLALPRPGAAVLKPPLLRWAPVSSASYFNVQLYRSGVKILSAWPGVAHLQLTSNWKYDGRTYALQPGLYTWYVWPGVGGRADAVYGDLLGKSAFSVVVSKKV